MINGYDSEPNTRLIMRAGDAVIYSEQNLSIENFEFEIKDNLIIVKKKDILAFFWLY